MNKEIIKKYKAEFDHWLDGGELLALYPEYKGEWVIATGISWLDDTAKYIIIDEYVEFRKALAESKTVQAFDSYYKEYKDVIKPVLFNLEASSYRIKPDEPKFEVGDYVVYDNQPEFEIGRWNLKFEQSYILSDRKDCYRLWTLEEASDDEWVIELKKDCKVNGVTCDLFTVMTAFTAKRLLRNKDVIVPYIGQTPKELGLEGELQ